MSEPGSDLWTPTRVPAARVMRAISGYMAESATILLVVTHEDYDLRYFVEKSYDFPELAG